MSAGNVDLNYLIQKTNQLTGRENGLVAVVGGVTFSRCRLELFQEADHLTQDALFYFNLKAKISDLCCVTSNGDINFSHNI